MDCWKSGLGTPQLATRSCKQSHASGKSWKDETSTATTTLAAAAAAADPLHSVSATRTSQQRIPSRRRLVPTGGGTQACRRTTTARCQTAAQTYRRHGIVTFQPTHGRTHVNTHTTTGCAAHTAGHSRTPTLSRYAEMCPRSSDWIASDSSTDDSVGGDSGITDHTAEDRRTRGVTKASTTAARV